MVVDVFDEAPNIGVDIQIPETSELRYFTDNLTQLIDRMTMNDNNDGDDDDNNDDDDDDDDNGSRHSNDDRFKLLDKDTVSTSYNDKDHGNVEIPEILKPLAQKMRGNDDSRYRAPDVGNVFCIVKPSKYLCI